MMFLEYRCGCRETTHRLYSKCPAHEETIKSAVVVGAEAFRLLYGYTLDLPSEGLFYPVVTTGRGRVGDSSGPCSALDT